MKPTDGFFRGPTEFLIEGYLAAAFGADMEDRPTCHRPAEHFFEAECLGTKLHVVVVPAASPPPLVFDGKRFGSELHQVGNPHEPEPITTEPHPANDTPGPFLVFLAWLGMNPLVGEGAFGSEDVFDPELLQAM